MTIARIPYVPRSKVVAELLGLFPNARSYCLDASYTLLDDDFLVRWKRAFEKGLRERGLSLTPFFDCDDFAKLAVCEAAALHMLRAKCGEIGGQGIAVGMVCYLADGAEHRGHATCVYRDAEGWSVWDPSLKESRVLDAAERESAWMIFI